MFVREPDVDKSYLWKGTLELKDNLTALRDYGVSANDRLEFRRKRSRGTNNTSFNRVQHRVVYQFSDNKLQRHALLSWLRDRWAMAPPVAVEFEPEGEAPREASVLPLTVTHHVILENASCQLEALDAQLQEESTAAPVTSEQPAEGAAAGSETNVQEDGALTPSTSLSLCILEAAGGPRDCPSSSAAGGPRKKKKRKKRPPIDEGKSGDDTER